MKKKIIALICLTINIIILTSLFVPNLVALETKNESMEINDVHVHEEELQVMAAADCPQPVCPPHSYGVAVKTTVWVCPHGGHTDEYISSCTRCDSSGKAGLVAIPCPAGLCVRPPIS